MTSTAPSSPSGDKTITEHELEQCQRANQLQPRTGAAAAPRSRARPGD